MGTAGSPRLIAAAPRRGKACAGRAGASTLTERNERETRKAQYCGSALRWPWVPALARKSALGRDTADRIRPTR
jgi:hypothetical protein